MILITSTGESLLYFTVSFSFVSLHLKKKKKSVLHDFFCVVLCAIFILQDCMSSGFEL